MGDLTKNSEAITSTKNRSRVPDLNDTNNRSSKIASDQG